jgi:capsular polysaccharide transport system ATP-binding protein
MKLMSAKRQLILNGVCKSYRTRDGMRNVLNGVSMHVAEGEKIGILGRNGAGKSTLIRLLSGAESPDQGQIVRAMSVSWPLAFGGAFQGSLTGLDNLRFICRIYGTSAEDKIDFVEQFSELGKYLREPVRKYSAGMRARLAFAISMVIEFDCFLIDEIASVGDARFHEKCNTELFVRRADRAMIIVSHDPGYIKAHCERAFVLSEGRLVHFEDIDSALEFYMREQLSSPDVHLPLANGHSASDFEETSGVIEEVSFSFLEGFVFGNGWGPVERADGHYRWMVSSRASLHLPLERGSDYRLTLHLGTHAACSGQSVHFELGGVLSDNVELSFEHGSDVTVTLPNDRIKEELTEVVVCAAQLASPMPNAIPLSLICTRMTLAKLSGDHPATSMYR